MQYNSNAISVNTRAAQIAMERLASEFNQFVEPYWRKERSPIDNKKWAKRKDNLPHPILKKTGAMQSKVIFKSDDTKLIAKMVDYGIFHQFGTEKMEARPWLGITKEAVEFFVDTLLEELIDD